MNTLIIIFLSTEDKFMPEMRLKQPEFKFSTSGPKKNKKKIRKLKKQIIHDIFIKMNQIKLVFNMRYIAYGEFKDFRD